MKNLIVNIFKTLFFFDFALIAISLIPDIKTENTALLSLWREGVSLAVIVLFTLIFLKKVEKKKLPLKQKKGNFGHAFKGILIGAVLPLTVLGIMWLLKSFTFSGFNKVSDWWFILPAILCNAVAGELLIRGYLFSLYKKHYGFIFTAVTTTLLFLSMNLEILKADKIYAAVIILLNILLCFVLDYGGSPVTTVFARFIYSLLSGFIIGGKLFGEAYPVLGKSTFSDKALINGGEYKIEGSIITLIILSLTVFIMLTVKYKLWRYLSKAYIRYYISSIKKFFGSIPKRISRRRRLIRR